MPNNKAFLLSIRPNWCKLIWSGMKTVEVRKTNPKAVQVPFKCYIYRTKTPHMAGAVIGEFTCDKIWELAPICRAPDDVEEQACMDRDYIVDYLRCKGCGWHISDLKIYDHPRPLSDFTRLRATKFGYEPVRIERPPQSWCYVMEE